VKDNLQWRAMVHRRTLESPDYIEAVMDACSKDPLFFLNGFAYTYDPRQNPFVQLPFILYPFQEEAILDLIRAIGSHDMLVEKSRDMGASWLCIAAAFWAWRFRGGQSFLFVSRVEDYVDKAGNPKAMFWKFDYLLKHLPAWMMPVGFVKSQHRSKMHILNPENESVVDGESTTGNAGRGDRRTAIFLDEFAAVEQGGCVLSATRDATNCRIFNSTPAGTGNAFFDMRQTNIKKLRLHWSVHPSKAAGLYQTNADGNLEILIPTGYPADYKPILDGKLRSPWYDRECGRCASSQEVAQELDIDYLGSGYQFFNADAVLEAIREYARPPTMVGDLDYDALTAEPTRFREDKSGRLELWVSLDKDDKPPTEHTYTIGVDVSAGTGASNSCISVWDLTLKEKAAQYAFPLVSPENLARQAVAIAKWFGNAFIIWESNGPGRQFGQRLRDLEYSNIYLRVRDEALSKKTTDVPGWASTPDGKKSLLGDYRDAISKGLCVNRSKVALEETLEYIFDGDSVVHSRSLGKDDPSGARSNHGDRAMADALAWKGMKDRKQSPKSTAREIPVGCLAWRNKQRELAKEEAAVHIADW